MAFCRRPYRSRSLIFPHFRQSISHICPAHHFRCPDDTYVIVYLLAEMSLHSISSGLHAAVCKSHILAVRLQRSRSSLDMYSRQLICVIKKHIRHFSVEFPFQDNPAPYRQSASLIFTRPHSIWPEGIFQEFQRTSHAVRHHVQGVQRAHLTSSCEPDHIGEPEASVLPPAGIHRILDPYDACGIIEIGQPLRHSPDCIRYSGPCCQFLRFPVK